MKKLMIVAACAAVAVFGGCRSIEIENKGEGQGWTVSVWSHWMNSEADGIAASIAPDGTVTFNMNGMKSTPSEEFNKTMKTYTSAFVQLAQIAAAAYNPSSSAAAAAAQEVRVAQDGSAAATVSTNRAECADGSCAVK